MNKAIPIYRMWVIWFHIKSTGFTKFITLVRLNRIRFAKCNKMFVKVTLKIFPSDYPPYGMDGKYNENSVRVILEHKFQVIEFDQFYHRR